MRAKGNDIILWTFIEEEPMPGIGLVSYLIKLYAAELALTFLGWKDCGEICSRTR